MSPKLEGVALVTGGGRGIGASIARELARAGMRVAVTGRTASQVESVAAETHGLALVGDVTREDEVETWMTRAEDELGPLSLVVANAGTSGVRSRAVDSEPDAWWRVFEVNVLGVFLTCRAALRRMAPRRRGRIVVLGSGASHLPTAARDGTAYGAS